MSMNYKNQNVKANAFKQIIMSFIFVLLINSLFAGPVDGIKTQSFDLSINLQDTHSAGVIVSTEQPPDTDNEPNQPIYANLNVTEAILKSSPLEFQNSWKFSLGAFRNIIAILPVYDVTSAYISFISDSYYPEILYSINPNIPVVLDMALRFYYTHTDLARNESYSFVYHTYYFELFSQMRGEIALWNSFTFVPYIEPRLLIDKSFEGFLFFGANIEFAETLKAGILLDSAKIEEIDYRFGIDLDVGKGFSINPGYAFNHSKTDSRHHVFMSVSFTYKNK